MLIAILLLVAVLIVPVAIIFALIGVTFSTVFDILVLIVKYLLPGVLLAVFFAIKKKDELRVGIIRLAVFLAVNLVIVVAFFRLCPEPETVNAADVASTVVFTEGYSERKPIEDSRTIYGTVPGNDFITDFLDNFDKCSFRRTVKELTGMPNDVFAAAGVQFLDSDGNVLQEFCVLQDNVIAVNSEGHTRYYKIEEGTGRLTGDIVKAIYKNYEELLINRVWGGFVAELKEGMYFKDGAVHFVIPQEVPGEYELTVDMYCGYIDEDTGKEMGYYAKIEWDHEELQDWVPGVDYSFSIGDRRLRRLGLYLKVEGKTYFIDIKPILPKEYTFR